MGIVPPKLSQNFKASIKFSLKEKMWGGLEVAWSDETAKKNLIDSENYLFQIFLIIQNQIKVIKSQWIFIQITSTLKLPFLEHKSSIGINVLEQFHQPLFSTTFLISWSVLKYKKTFI